MRIYLYTFSLVLLLACNNSKKKADAYGNFEAVEYQISAMNSGELINSTAREGMRVESGQLLAIIDTTAIALQIEELDVRKQKVQTQFPSVSAEIDQLETQLKNLKQEKNRFRSLVESGAGRQKDLDDIESNIEQVEKQIATAETKRPQLAQELAIIEQKRKQLKHRIKHSKVYAPINGQILDVYKRKGEVIAQGRTLLTMASLDTLDLKVYISETQLPHIQVGDSVKVSIDKTENSMYSRKGIVFRISDEAEFTPNTIQTKEERVDLVYAVEIRVPNPEGKFKIGMPAEVDFLNSKTASNAQSK